MNPLDPNTPHTPAPGPTSVEQELAQALSFIGHDARAGHSSTLALLELQRIQADPMSQAHLLSRIEANARRSLEAIDDFADLVRARRQVLRLDELELTDLVVEVVADAWAAAHEHGVRIQVMPGAESVPLRADRGLLTGALAKLLRDAVGAAAPGSDIRCSVRGEGAGQVIEIAGAVTAPPDLPERRSATAARPATAGLLLARGVVGRHGGQVEQQVVDGIRCTRMLLPTGEMAKSSVSKLLPDVL